MPAGTQAARIAQPYRLDVGHDLYEFAVVDRGAVRAR